VTPVAVGVAPMVNMPPGVLQPTQVSEPQKEYQGVY